MKIRLTLFDLKALRWSDREKVLKKLIEEDKTKMKKNYYMRKKPGSRKKVRCKMPKK